LKSFVGLIQAHRATSKIISTYLLSEGKNGEKKGFIPLVNARDGCIHHGLDMVQTITGRLNGKNPNMQNVPKDFRSLFPSRYGKDGVIVEFDYGQLEICISAYLTQSPRLMADVRNGVDFHLKRAGYVAGITYEEVLDNYKREPEVWKEKRQQAKAVSYAKAYGAHPEKIAEDTGLSLETVELIFTKEAEEYPEVGDYNKQIEEEVRRSRVPTAELLSIRDKETRARSTIQGEHKGAGHFKSVTGKRYCYYEYGVNSAKLRESGRGIYRYFKTTELANYPVQGLGADIMSTTVGKLFRKLLTWKLSGVTLLNEVHDSVVFDCKDRETADKLVEMVVPILMNVDQAFKEKFNGVKFNVPIGVDVKISRTWGE
jgi:DNA polymerase I-like protein with 3'-5' exonuclease and polymerase domains